MRHSSVLLHEVLEAFEGKALSLFVDGTLGAGGHASALLEAHPEIEAYFGFDQDANTLKETTRELKEKVGSRFIPIHANFSEMKEILKAKKIKSVDGILLDLGVSSMQLDQKERGFSFSKEGPLDMRMNPEGDLKASDVVNTYSERELKRVFSDYGELKNGNKIAHLLVEKRKKKKFETTFDLTEVLEPLMPYRKGNIHPMTLVFQALRIEVNEELSHIEKVIPDAIDLLSLGGRLAILSFHSLEDRIVKQAFCYESGKSSFAKASDPSKARIILVTKKPIVPTEKEIKKNPRSRSAKLRIAEKKNKDII